MNVRKMIECEECGEKCKQITWKHLKYGCNGKYKTVAEYREAHPCAPILSETTHKQRSEHSCMKRPEVVAKMKVWANSPEGKVHHIRVGKRVQELYPDNWQIGLKYLNKNSPFKYMDVGWNHSPIQRDITRLLFEKLGIIPIKGVNCQIYYGHNEFDFKLLGCIYEPHVLYTYGGTETREQYTTRKRNTMNSNGFKDHELVVTTTLQEAEKLID